MVKRAKGVNDKNIITMWAATASLKIPHSHNDQGGLNGNYIITVLE